jgi:putative spermidine/putrescine transport system substrate-binding protein
MLRSPCVDRRKYMVAALASIFLVAAGNFNPVSLSAQEATLPPDAPGPLVVAGWGGFTNKLSQDVFSDDFTVASGTQVQWLAVPGQQVAAIQAQTSAGQIQWDIAVSLLADQFALLKQQGLLLKLPAKFKAHAEKEMPDGVNDYAISGATVSDVITCNSKSIAACPKTPKDFFNLKDFPGNRSMYNGGPLIAMAMALQADGVPADRLFPMDIDRAFHKLQEIKPAIKVFWQSGDQSEQIFRNGEVVAAIIWNGRAYNLATHPTDRMVVEVSWQGAVYEPTWTVVVKGAPRSNSALKLLQWIVDHPAGMARYAEKTRYGFPHPGLFKSVDKDIAPWVPEYPGHFKDEARLNYDWYLEHRKDIDARWKEFISGS